MLSIQEIFYQLLKIKEHKICFNEIIKDKSLVLKKKKILTYIFNQTSIMKVIKK